MIVRFHSHKDGSKPFMAPAFYADKDHTKVACRVYADKAPSVNPATFDIYDDGVSIFNERGANRAHLTTGVIATYGAGTSQIINEKENSEAYIDDFTDGYISNGSWITCEIIDANGGDGFSVQLELEEAGNESD